jgi:hypothetical protein
MSDGIQNLTFNDKRSCYTVMPRSKVLLPITFDSGDSQPVVITHNYSGLPARVRIQSVFKGPKKKSIMLYYGKVRSLEWDPTRLKWPEGMEFMHYSTKLGRNLLRKRHPPLQLAAKK